MPITSPAVVTSGPPELPGLSAASVCRTSSINRPDRDRSDRPSALTTPAVTECWKPYGLPMAIATCPTRTQSRIAQRRPRQRFSLGRHDADDRQIGVGIGPDTIRQHRSTIRHHHRDAPGPLDHVMVGENQSVGREADARTAAVLDVDLDDGRPDRLDGANHGLRIRVEQFAVVNRFWLEAHDPILRTGPSSHTTQTGEGARC